MPFGWLRSITLTPNLLHHFLWEHNVLIYVLLIYANFFTKKKLWRETRVWCIWLTQDSGPGDFYDGGNRRIFMRTRNFVLNWTNTKTFNDLRLKSSKMLHRPPLWSSGQSFWLQIQRSRVRFPALSDFLSSRGSGTGSTQPREPRVVNWGATWIKKVAAPGLENRD